MGVFRVTLEGPEVQWKHRDAAEYWERPPGTKGLDDKGQRRNVVKPGVRTVDCEAESKDAAVALALSREAHDGYVKVLSVEQRKG